MRHFSVFFFSEPEVPYYVSVEAFNSIGASDPSNEIGFTKQGSKSSQVFLQQQKLHTNIFSLCLAPSKAPEFTITWTSLTAMDVSWIPLTLEEARGFVTGYTVTYTAEEEEKRRKRDHDSGSETVPGDESSVAIDGLDPDAQYSVSVAAETAAGVGVPSEPMTAPSKLTIL